MLPGTLTVVVLVPGTRYLNIWNSPGESEIIDMQEHLLLLHTRLYSALFPHAAISSLLSLTHLSTSTFARTFIRMKMRTIRILSDSANTASDLVYF